MFFNLENYQCSKCKNIFQWSLSEDPLGLQEPYCLNCYKKFINENVPIGKK